MASLIPGYEYDIFISYRQKDNKYDGWVTEFVDNLNKELEATFKEDLSVYFDIDPHDGLLETHDVDASLKDKLRCLVFIPIISRTYCDLKSFAWEYEFKAFVEQASNDQFGLKVKLPNGNVATRVLPVRIYDLDTADIKLFESVMGGVIRSVDFIYKSAGVNRPLNPSDNPDKNLNKTYYRDQINKVANSIKEIVTSIEQYIPQKAEVEEIKEVFKPISVTQKDNHKKIIIETAVILALIVPGYFLIPKIFKPSVQLEKSIAVLPFINDSSNDSTTYFMNGVMDEILNNLQKISNFSRVLSRTSTEKYRSSTKSSLTKIAQELNVNYIVEGSGQKYGNKFVLRIQLIAADKEKHLWGKSYKQEILKTTDIITIQSQIAQSIAGELKAIITSEEKNRIEKAPTENLEAYNLFFWGKSYYNHHTKESVLDGIKYFSSAIHIDTTFALAYIRLAQSYQLMVRYSWMNRDEGSMKAKNAILKAIELDESLGEAHAMLGLIKVVFDLNIYDPEKEFQKAIKLSPNNSEVYSSYAQYLRWIGKYDQGVVIAKRAVELDPFTPLTCMWLGSIYFFAGNYDESIKALEKTLALDSNFAESYAYLSYDYFFKGLSEKAVQCADKALSIGNTKDLPVIGFLGWVYAKSGEIVKAKRILARLVELSKNGNVDPVFLAAINDGLSEKEKAFYLLSKAYESHSGLLIYLSAYKNTFFKDISSDARYVDLLKKIGFKENYF